MFLTQITGLEGPKSFFRRAIGTARLAHAYLFTGPAGSGKRRFARELAKAFYCVNGSACGSCPACGRIEHGNHPSVNTYGPAEGKAMVDIDTIRALCERTHYKSSDVQVAILEQADLLNEPAANALLKTLEEPPGQFVIILTAQSTGSLLPTIVSRCHRVSFPLPEARGEEPAEEARHALRDAVAPNFFAHEDPRAWLSRAVPGESSPRAALRRLLDLLVKEWREKLEGAGGIELDDILRRLGAFIELRQDLERNINPDLVLERLLRVLRRGG